MPLNSNYRLIYLYALLDVIGSDSVRKDNIEFIDAEYQTQFIRAVSRHRSQPAFVRWFDFGDTLYWLFMDDKESAALTAAIDEVFAEDELSDRDFGDRDGGDKVVVEQAASTASFLSYHFSPTRDPALRGELGLDPNVDGEFWSIRFSFVKDQLALSQWTDVQAPRLARLAGKNLAYALYATRNAGLDKLAAYCLAAFFRIELDIKLIRMRSRSQWQSDGAAKQSLPHLDRLLAFLEPDSPRDYHADYLEWALDITLDEEKASELDRLFARIQTLLHEVDARNWEAMASPEHLLQLVRDYCRYFKVII